MPGKISNALKPAHLIQKYLSGGRDFGKLRISQYNRLPLFITPLTGGNPSRHPNPLLGHVRDTSYSNKDNSHTNNDTSHVNNDESTRTSSDPEKCERLGEPRLKDQDEERTIIRLFYDLFFVANLTTFTEIHNVNDGDSLKSYLGFFTLLWFTWFQVTLYDVRFGNDCLFERVCKALQFGVMIGFAVVGPDYNTSEVNEASRKTYDTLALILMASRIVLAGQYAVALYWIVWTKNAKQSYLPLLGHIVTLLVSAAVFLGMYFVFRLQSSNSQDLDVWYVILPLEAASVLLLSAATDLLSFRRNIVKRLGDLTLIILGEGVIALCGAIRKVNSSGTFGSDSIGLIVSAIVTIFFLWMLYFDGIANEKQQDVDDRIEKSQEIGTVRQSFWMVAHFPFHVSVLLVVEGLSQLTVWKKFNDSYDMFVNNINGLYPFNSSTLVSALNETLNNLYEPFDDSNVSTPNMTEIFHSIRTSQNNQTEIENDILTVVDEAIDWLSQAFEIQIPKNYNLTEAGDRTGAVYGTFATVFLYFFIAAGCTLVALAALFWLGKRRYSRDEYILISIRTISGIGLTLFAIFNPGDISTHTLESPSINYFISSWMLPTVTLVCFIVVLLDHLVINYFSGKSSNNKAVP